MAAVATSEVALTARRLAGLEQTDRVLEIDAASLNNDRSVDAIDDCFDAVVASSAALPSPHTLREMVRVVRPGGHVIVIADGIADEHDGRSYVAAAMHAVGLRAPFGMGADPRKLRRRLVGAGLTKVVVALTVEALDVHDGDALLRWLGDREPVDQTHKEAVVSVLDEMLRERDVTASFAVAVGTK